MEIVTKADFVQGFREQGGILYWLATQGHQPTYLGRASALQPCVVGSEDCSVPVVSPEDGTPENLSGGNSIVATPQWLALATGSGVLVSDLAMRSGFKRISTEPVVDAVTGPGAYVRMAPARVDAVGSDSQSPTTVLQGPDVVFDDVVASPSFLFVLAVGGQSAVSVRKFSRGTTLVQSFTDGHLLHAASGSESAWYLAAADDDGLVFVTAPGTLWRSDASCREPTCSRAIRTLPRVPKALAADRTHVYWLEDDGLFRANHGGECESDTCIFARPSDVGRHAFFKMVLGERAIYVAARGTVTYDQAIVRFAK